MTVPPQYDSSIALQPASYLPDPAPSIVYYQRTGCQTQCITLTHIISRCKGFPDPNLPVSALSPCKVGMDQVVGPSSLLTAFVFRWTPCDTSDVICLGSPRNQSFTVEACRPVILSIISIACNAAELDFASLVAPYAFASRRNLGKMLDQLSPEQKVLPLGQCVLRSYSVTIREEASGLSTGSLHKYPRQLSASTYCIIKTDTGRRVVIRYYSMITSSGSGWLTSRLHAPYQSSTNVHSVTFGEIAMAGRERAESCIFGNSVRMVEFQKLKVTRSAWGHHPEDIPMI